MNDTTKLLQRAHDTLLGFNQIIDQVLPQAGRLVLDVGLVNDTLISASAFMREYAEPRSMFVVTDADEKFVAAFATQKEANDAYPYQTWGPIHLIREVQI